MSVQACQLPAGLCRQMDVLVDELEQRQPEDDARLLVCGWVLCWLLDRYGERIIENDFTGANAATGKHTETFSLDFLYSKRFFYST